jgi:hypothetical protein
VPELPEGIYEGSSKAEAPDEEPALKHALKSAYEKGMAAKSTDERRRPDGSDRTFRFIVVSIVVEGTNPPSDYKVTVKDHGHD